MTKPVIHLYCDESCHLQYDASSVMVLGAVWCDASRRAFLGREIKATKRRFGIAPNIEIKWTKVSPARQGFYLALIDLFFDSNFLRYRAVIIPDKDLLRHEAFGQTHDDFYYKMWWQLLNHLIDEEHAFRLFLDVKDTRGASRIRRLGEVLRNANYDFDHEIVSSVELVHSHDVPLMQIVDLLTGAIGYAHRGLSTSPAKLALLDRIRARSGHLLLRSTLPSARKFNIFVWRGQ